MRPVRSVNCPKGSKGRNQYEDFYFLPREVFKKIINAYGQFVYIHELEALERFGIRNALVSVQINIRELPVPGGKIVYTTHDIFYDENVTLFKDGTILSRKPFRYCRW